MDYKYLESKRDVQGGKVCVKGTRISADLILEWMANGASVQDIVSSYPQISSEAITEVLLYASRIAKNEIQLHLTFAA
jgi:uncharacterized protein (DUF433 family)